MRIIDSGVLPNGVDIQLESWGENGSSLMIAAYPMAQRTCGFWIRGGERFRLQISNNPYTGYTDEMVQSDYFSLLRGEKSLCDLSENFWNGERDKWCLGMDTGYIP